MLRRLLSVAAACLMMLALVSTAQAGTSDNVKDLLNYLTTDEVNDLQGRIEGIGASRGLDVVIVITDDIGSKSPTAYADDYFDYNGYGIGSDRSGLLLLVSMGTRDVVISTSGKAISIFTDSRLDDILDEVSSYLSDGEYYKACLEFLEQVDYYATLGAPGGSGSGSGSYLSRAASIAKSPVVYVIAAVIALIATLAVSSASRGTASITNRTYEESGSFELILSRDDYLRETTSRVKINSSSGAASGGSKGSSVHRSSSGRTHGGRSRKF
ncbi:MAG TPA: TPM domain-containing protein [Candidatus Atribacteria bacterium]|nr:TPM domain-containing protein [Candidatus Atribacteria bacterium]